MYYCRQHLLKKSSKKKERDKLMSLVLFTSYRCYKREVVHNEKPLNLLQLPLSLHAGPALLPPLLHRALRLRQGQLQLGDQAGGPRRRLLFLGLGPLPRRQCHRSSSSILVKSIVTSALPKMYLNFLKKKIAREKSLIKSD